MDGGFDWTDHEWVATFVGGPYDGAEVVILAVTEFVGVKRVRIAGKRRMSVRANPPSPTPPGYELYRLDGHDRDTATYVYAELDFETPAPEASAYAGRPVHGGYPVTA